MKIKIIAITVLILYTLVIGLDCSVYADDNEKVVVLVYHHLLKDSENKNKINAAIVSVENFEKQMKYLHNNGYKTITIQALNNYLKYGKSLPKKSVLITFDDGYKSNYVYAYPILKKYNFKASIFMITGSIPDIPQPFNPNRLSFMSKGEIVKSKDVFELACHTHSLHKLEKNRKSALLNSEKKTIAKDLRMSKQLIYTKFFAYPHGQYNKHIKNILKEEGFELAFTVKKGSVSKQSNRFELNRVPIFYNTSIYEFKKILNGYKEWRKLCTIVTIKKLKIKNIFDMVEMV